LQSSVKKTVIKNYKGEMIIFVGQMMFFMAEPEVGRLKNSWNLFFETKPPGVPTKFDRKKIPRG